MSDFTGLFKTSEKIADNQVPIRKELSDLGNIIVSDDVQGAEKDGTKLFLFGSIYKETNGDIVQGILNAYLDEGIETFKKLDGEFTLIVLSDSKTIIFRDRHGAGPQVYYNKTAYSSFLKNFLTLKGFDPKPNVEALATFLSIGYVPSPMSSLDGVQKIPGGNLLITDDKDQRLENLYSWEEYRNACSNPLEISEDEATARYEELHLQAIKRRVAGKKKVGLLLSGGYDSGGNIAGLREVYSGEAYSYSIGFKDNPWTELPLAKILSERFGTKHAEYEIDGTEIKELPELVEYLGDPFQEGGLMVNYTAMKLVGEDKPDVILGGDGNDQHFGTAGKELAMNWTLRKKGLAGFQKLYANLGAMGMFDKDNIFFRTQFHNDKILNIQKSDNFGFKRHNLKHLLKNATTLKPHRYLWDVPTRFTDFNDFYFVHNYFGDIRQVINEVILFKASKMSAMFGNSLSFPYMNTEIYEFLKTIQRNLKCKGTLDDLVKGRGVTKFLHKNYLKPKLPTEITDRKKQGGFAPLPIFFKDEIQRKKLKDFVLGSDAAKHLFSEKYLIRFFEEYDNNVKSGGYWFWYKQVQAFRFFNLVVICMWWEIFINKRSKEELSNFIN